MQAHMEGPWCQPSALGPCCCRLLPADAAVGLLSRRGVPARLKHLMLKGGSMPPSTVTGTRTAASSGGSGLSPQVQCCKRVRHLIHRWQQANGTARQRMHRAFCPMDLRAACLLRLRCIHLADMGDSRACWLPTLLWRRQRLYRVGIWACCLLLRSRLLLVVLMMLARFLAGQIRRHTPQLRRRPRIPSSCAARHRRCDSSNARLGF